MDGESQEDNNQFPSLCFGQVNNFVVFKSFFVNRAGNIFTLLKVLFGLFDLPEYWIPCCLSLDCHHDSEQNQPLCEAASEVRA